MSIYDVIIIGGGVAGFFSAIKLLEHDDNATILLLEKENAPLKKLLTTGSGACNFTHTGTIDDFITKYGNNGQFLRNAFNNFFVNDIVYFFEENGIKTYCRDDGKFFPKSMKASDIKNLLLEKTKTIESVYSFNVHSVAKENDIFHITAGNKTYHSKKVLITTGGKSFPSTGSSGSGYILAKQLGHTITDIKPSLASIYCKNNALSQFSGISFEQITITHTKNKKQKKYVGTLLLTHKGFSGPVIIDNSRDFTSGDTLLISFTQEKKQTVVDYIQESKHELCIQSLKKFCIPKKMALFFLEEAQIKYNKKNCEISKKKINDLVELLCSFPVVISSIEGFETCMCTSGGVSLKEVNPKTFESKITKGLYFLGEVLDIDGDSGGYNLQAIWSECAIFSENFF